MKKMVLLFVIVAQFTSPSFASPGKPTASQNQIMKFTDLGIKPNVLKMKREDSIAFFLNSTSDALATFEVDFGDKATHCASSNMNILEAGVIRSIKPFGPRDFASICFHDAGKYPVTVYGLKQKPSGIKATILVE